MKTPYTIAVDNEVIADMQRRIAQTRWPDEIQGAGWNYGTSKPYLQSLCEHWSTQFNWQKQEAHLNSFSHFKTVVDGVGLHFIHQKGSGKNPIPLLLVHGFPDSIVRFLKLIPLLTAAGEDGLSFDVIVPSIPGFGFSDIPTVAGTDPAQIGHLFAKLMTGILGYKTFMAHGGDWGANIAEQIAVHHPEVLTGIHLTEIPFIHLLGVDESDLTPAEKKYMEAGRQWQQKEGAYAMIQSTKPQSLAYGLNDSPAGLAAWIMDKFQSWSDCGTSLDNCFSKDDLLTNITIYWVTQTINSACRLYYEMAGKMEKSFTKPAVPAGVAIFPKDLVPAPEEYGKRIFNIKQWTKMPQGGHFAAMEQPSLLEMDIRKFARTLISLQQ